MLVRAGVRFDEQLSTRVFNASFESYLSQSRASPSRAFADLITLRQFITGTGHLRASSTRPGRRSTSPSPSSCTRCWACVALVFAVVQGALAWFGHRKTVAPAEAAAKAGGDVNAYLQSKLRNAEVIEVDGHAGQPAPALARAGRTLYLAQSTQCAGRQQPRDGLEQVHPLQPAVAVAGCRRAAGDRGPADARRA